MNARDYYLGFQRTVHGAPYVLNSDLCFEEVDEHVGYMAGVLLFIDDFQLYLAEYVLTAPVVRRPKYRYHLQTLAGQLISRWDNATHHHTVSNLPDHRHDDQGSNSSDSSDGYSRCSGCRILLHFALTIGSGAPTR